MTERIDIIQEHVKQFGTDEQLHLLAEKLGVTTVTARSYITKAKVSGQLDPLYCLNSRDREMLQLCHKFTMQQVPITGSRLSEILSYTPYNRLAKLCDLGWLMHQGGYYELKRLPDGRRITGIELQTEAGSA